MHMKMVLSVLLLLTTAALAQTNEAIKAETPPPEDNWPTLDTYWFNGEYAGTPSAEIKLGYEYSDLDDAAGNDPAHALIARIRLNYQTAVWKGFDAFVQAQYVGPIVKDYQRYDATKDPVADPEAFRFHQLYVGWAGYDTRAKVGAQEILLDNQRFIGNVGWRMNAQSFNAAYIDNQSIDNLKVLYSYTDSINAPDGENNDERQYHLINAEYKVGENNRIAGLAYLQRNDKTDSVDTYGLRYWGKNGTISHDATIAFQRSAFYGYLKGAKHFEKSLLELGLESISGGADPDDQFQTLNGTAHAFNGWADQFLGTGGGLTSGLVDFWVKGKMAATEKMDLIAVYHLFHTATDANGLGFSGIYGHEVDAEAKYKFTQYIDASATVAFYMKDEDEVGNFTTDETVFWLRGTFKF